MQLLSAQSLWAPSAFRKLHMNDADLQRSLGTVEGKLDLLIDLHQKSEERQSGQFDDLGNRVGAVERWQSRALGWTAGIAGTVGVLYAIVSLVK